ncbi:MAG: glucosaminidase domain-containing protein [Snowella sp.]|nr:glucosaminidase domain-containing protein [Snowella sp.]
MALLDDLITRYAATDLGNIFREVDTTDKRAVDLTKINSEHYLHLKEITLAQWLLESGRATSKLANEHKNFAGLKWRTEMTPFASAKLIKVPSETTKVEFCFFDNIDKFLRGYWKFLTRSPYAGLEDNTKTPESFIGFIQSKGFAADMSYISKVLSLLPEAHNLLSQASGFTLPSQPDTLEVIGFPKAVEVGQGFKVEGTASASDAGKKLSVLIDDQFKGNDVLIGADSKWQFNFVFTQAGDRKIKISLGPQNEEITIKASVASTIGAVTIPLSGSVGQGGVNRPADKLAIKKRLHELGFTFVGNPTDPSLNTGFIQAIKLFQSIIAGRSTLAGDGRVDVNGTTHLWLQAANAPRWQTMPDTNLSISLRNREKEETADDHDFGTSWLADAILEIATDYHNNFRSSNPTAAPFTLNDVSRPHGGDTPDHSGHETGLMCDVYLPRKDGQAGGIDMNSSSYDRDATRELLKAMRRHKLVREIFFNDPLLRNEKFNGKNLCNFASGHHHHIHFEINPPVRA